MPAGLRGNFTYFSPEEIMYLLSRFKKTGRLDMGEGSVYFHQGNVVHSKTNEQEGLDAFYYLAMKTGGEFTFYPEEKAPKNSISSPLAELFQEIERRQAEIEEVLKELPPLNTVPSKSIRSSGKDKIAMSKIHWKILILIDGKRDLKKIIEDSGIEKSEAMRALLWLFNEGLIFDPKEKERILKTGLEKISIFLKEFGEGPWIDIIKEKIKEAGLDGYFSVTPNNIVLNRKDMDVSLERIKQWVEETLLALKGKAEELLGKIIVKKKWKVVDGTK